jgi:NAD(P)-dependent dehydrogenase (short-subunit alcohol dehydrogenase family)
MRSTPRWLGPALRPGVVLVNNAGFTNDVKFEDLTLEVFDALHAVHLRGPLVATQTAYRHMMKNKYGRIVFTSSSPGVFGRLGGAAYSTAKAGLVGLMNGVALESEPNGVLMNALLPAGATGISGFKPGYQRPPLLKSAIELMGDAYGSAEVEPIVTYLASGACQVNKTYLFGGWRPVRESCDRVGGGMGRPDWRHV